MDGPYPLRKSDAHGARRGVRGVGGWLLFFLLSFGLIWPLLLTFVWWDAVYGPFDSLRIFPGFSAFVTCQTVVFIANLFVVAFSVFCLLFIRTGKSVLLATAGVWLAGIGTNIANSVIFFVTMPELRSNFIFDPVSLLACTVYPTIWTIYFKKSDRVLNTYHRQPRRLEEIFE